MYSLKRRHNMKNKIAAIIGGDERFLILGKMLEKKGNTVCCIGQKSELTEEEMKHVKNAEIIILPMPCTNDGKRINGGAKPFITEELTATMEGKPVFAGMTERLENSLRERLRLYDYGKREDYLILNAQATAEAAIARAVELSPRTLFDSKVLVIGFGRIGKALTNMLKAIGAEVTVCARRSEHFAQIECIGAKKAEYSELGTVAEASDIIINTVPAPVLDESMIAGLSDKQVIIDLASGEGGVDFTATEKYGITAEHALSLPGKYSHESAARFIYDTIDAMIKEGDIR